MPVAVKLAPKAAVNDASVGSVKAEVMAAAIAEKLPSAEKPIDEITCE